MYYVVHVPAEVPCVMIYKKNNENINNERLHQYRADLKSRV